jgi:hypothetical protein
MALSVLLGQLPKLADQIALDLSAAPTIPRAAKKGLTG